ncbi:MAG: AAA family ATPase, partial [Oscillospiraceae bacterium]|nr:AAA family ATPase [Oscillospiraceae bacterium]
MILRDSYVNRIMAFADTPLVKILTGVRRCGKSTILSMIRDRLIARGVPEDHILTYRFDSMEYDGMTAAGMYRDIKGKLNKEGRTYVFLDEVQEIKGWEKIVNSLQTDFDTDIYVTGSNSRMMSSEIETYLTGRYVSFRIFTLSFSEYLTFKKEHSPLEDTRRELA